MEKAKDNNLLLQLFESYVTLKIENYENKRRAERINKLQMKIEKIQNENRDLKKLHASCEKLDESLIKTFSTLIFDISLRRQVIRGCSSKTTAEELESYFSRYGEVEDISNFPSPKNGRAPYAFITFSSLNQVPPRDHNFQGRSIVLEKINVKYENYKSKTIIANGLLTNLKEFKLAEYFSRYGEVLQVNKQQRGTVLRFAFVTFKDYSSVDEALKNVLHLIDGKIVDIRKARDYSN